MCVTCVLLENKANPNIRDSKGIVLLWDALVGNHKPIINLPVLEKADLSNGDVKQFAHFAIEQNNLKLLKSVFFYGGDNINIRVLNTSLHTAISEGNTEIVEFLLRKGAEKAVLSYSDRRDREIPVSVTATGALIQSHLI